MKRTQAKERQTIPSLLRPLSMEECRQVAGGGNRASDEWTRNMSHRTKQQSADNNDRHDWVLMDFGSQDVAL